MAGYIDHVIPWRVQFSLRAGFCRPFSLVFLGVFLLCEQFITIVVDFAIFRCFFFLSVSSKVCSTCLATRWTASRLRLSRPVTRCLRVMNPPFQPHKIPLPRRPLPRRPLRSQSQWRLSLRPSTRLFSSRFLRCWQPFGRTECQTLLPAARQAIPVQPLSRPARRQLIHRFRLSFVELGDLLTENMRAQEAKPHTYLDGKLLVAPVKKRVVEINNILTWIQAFTIDLLQYFGRILPSISCWSSRRRLSFLDHLGWTTTWHSGRMLQPLF